LTTPLTRRHYHLTPESDHDGLAGIDDGDSQSHQAHEAEESDTCCAAAPVIHTRGACQDGDRDDHENGECNTENHTIEDPCDEAIGHRSHLERVLVRDIDVLRDLACDRYNADHIRGRI